MTQPKNETQRLKLTPKLRTVQEHKDRKFKNQQEQTRTQRNSFFYNTKTQINRTQESRIQRKEIQESKKKKQ